MRRSCWGCWCERSGSGKAGRQRGELAGVLRSGGVLRRGSEENAKEREEWISGAFVVLMRVRGKSGGLCSGLSTAALRWRPHGGSGRRGRAGRLQRKAKEGGEGAARRVEATRQAGGGAGAALHGGRAAHGTGGGEVAPWQPHEARRGRVASGGGTSARGMGPEACGGAT